MCTKFNHLLSHFWPAVGRKQDTSNFHDERKKLFHISVFDFQGHMIIFGSDRLVAQKQLQHIKRDTVWLQLYLCVCVCVCQRGM